MPVAAAKRDYYEVLGVKREATQEEIKSAFRQLAKNRLTALGKHCRCIRCREIGRRPSLAESEVQVIRYECCSGTEHFISAVSSDSLIGFARLRFPSSEIRPELRGAALLRELHIYGSLVPVGVDAARTDEWQHRSFGRLLLSRAEEITSTAGFGRLAIMSGIGVRPYYWRQGYERSGPYMVKEMA
jgi:elongator complex protein 3